MSVSLTDASADEACVAMACTHEVAMLGSDLSRLKSSAEVAHLGGAGLPAKRTSVRVRQRQEPFALCIRTESASLLHFGEFH